MEMPLAALNTLPKPTSFQGFGYSQGGVNVAEGEKATGALAAEETAHAESQKALQSARDELAKQQAELQKKTEEKNQRQAEKTRLEGERTSKQSALSTLKSELASAQAAVQSARDEVARRQREEDARRVAMVSPTPMPTLTPSYSAPEPMRPFEAEIQRNVQISPSQPTPPPMGAAVFNAPSKPAPYAPPPMGAATFYATQADKDKADREKAMASLGKALKGWF